MHAIKGKSDPLIGLKENVIIGKLLPSGTGMKCYGKVELVKKMEEFNKISIDTQMFEKESEEKVLTNTES